MTVGLLYLTTCLLEQSEDSESKLQMKSTVELKEGVSLWDLDQVRRRKGIYLT